MESGESSFLVSNFIGQDLSSRRVVGSEFRDLPLQLLCLRYVSQSKWSPVLTLIFRKDIIDFKSHYLLEIFHPVVTKSFMIHKRLKSYSFFEIQPRVVLKSISSNTPSHLGGFFTVGITLYESRVLLWQRTFIDSQCKQH